MGNQVCLSKRGRFECKLPNYQICFSIDALFAHCVLRITFELAENVSCLGHRNDGLLPLDWVNVNLHKDHLTSKVSALRGP